MAARRRNLAPERIWPHLQGDRRAVRHFSGAGPQIKLRIDRYLIVLKRFENLSDDAPLTLVERFTKADLTAIFGIDVAAIQEGVEIALNPLAFGF